MCEDHCGKQYKNQNNLDAHLKRVNNQMEKTKNRMRAFQSEIGIDGDLDFGQSIESSQPSI